MQVKRKIERIGQIVRVAFSDGQRLQVRDGTVDADELASHANRVQNDKERVAAPGDTVGHHIQDVHGVVDIAHNLGQRPRDAHHEYADTVARRRERIRDSPDDKQARQDLEKD